MTTSITAPISVSALVSTQLPDSFIPGTLLLKKKKLKKTMGLPLIPSHIMTISQDVCTFLSPSHRPPMFSGDVMSYPSLKR